MRHLAIVLALALLACGDSPTENEPDLDIRLAFAELTILSGDLQSDTILARLTDPLEIQLLDSLGLPIADAPIRFVVTEDGCGDAFLGNMTTDAEGKAADVWDLGPLAGDCTMEVRALDSDNQPRVETTFTATVQPGAPFSSNYWSEHEPPNHMAALGDSLRVLKETGRIEDQAGNAIPWSVTILSGPFEAADLGDAWVMRSTSLGTGSAEVSTASGVWLAITLDTCEDGQGDTYTRWVSESLALPEGCP